MNEKEQLEIIKRIQKQTDEFDSCSILKIAEDVVYYKISMSDQIKIAKLIVKSNSYVTKKKGSEIIVNKNLLYQGSVFEVETESDYKNLKYVVGGAVGLLMYITFHFFLPNLKINTTPRNSSKKVIKDTTTTILSKVQSSKH